MTRLALLVCVLGFGVTRSGVSDDRPVFRVDVSSPTADKPQSKLWYAENHWWAWLPTRSGSSIWRRTPTGWQRLTELDAPLTGLPGRADVWADADGIRAVLVGPDRLAVIGFQFDPDAKTYRLAGEPVTWRTGDVETATIARDGAGRWWVAYPRNLRPWVRSSADGITWDEPTPLGDPVDADDICCAVALPGTIGVIWSDQKTDTVWFRRHRDNQPTAVWEPAEIVARGGKTADDHLNAAIAPDGTLFVATKNSVDTMGMPQLVLRVRRPNGVWDNHPYANRTADGEPSRPIAVLGGKTLFLAHTVYVRDGTRPDPIAVFMTDSQRLDLTATPIDLIAAARKVNNVTATKAPLPAEAGVPWLVLASDTQGHVYEAVLPRSRE